MSTRMYAKMIRPSRRDLSGRIIRIDGTSKPRHWPVYLVIGLCVAMIVAFLIGAFNG